MTKPTSGKHREMTNEERQRLAALREKIQQEIPDLVARNQMRDDARREASLSGALRRAVHSSNRPLTHLAREVGIEPTMLDEFLTGERNLLSEVLNRLAKAVGYDLSQTAPAPKAAPPAGLTDSPATPDVART
jgi:transcriptional regulator with XRE-family HTH domain